LSSYVVSVKDIGVFFHNFGSEKKTELQILRPKLKKTIFKES